MVDDPEVLIRLSEIQRIRDVLARIRHHHPQIMQLFNQLAGLYQRKAKEIQQQVTRPASVAPEVRP
jgi:hypothetical protein